MFYNVNNICKQPTEIGLVVWGGGGLCWKYARLVSHAQNVLKSEMEHNPT